MRKFTQKELRALVNSGSAVDVTAATIATYDEIKQKEGYLRQIGYSCGVYGCNGKLLQGSNTGTLYAVTTRSTAIYIF